MLYEKTKSNECHFKNPLFITQRKSLDIMTQLLTFLQETFLQIPVSAIYERPIKLFSEWIEAERYFSNAQ